MKIGLTFNVKQQEQPAARDDEQEEFDSPATIEALANAIRSHGHEVELLGEGPALVRRLASGPPPDLVFNIAEGTGVSRSREARVPALLETLGIPYTGSDPLTLAVTLDKDVAKRLVRDAGLPTPPWVCIRSDDDLKRLRPDLERLKLPAFVKPCFEGSSKGIRNKSLAATRDQLFETVAELRRGYRQPILIEEFIEGDELTVGIVGNGPGEVLGIMRVVPRDQNQGPFIYGLEMKRDWERLIRYESPAAISERDATEVRLAALAIFDLLGCRDVARVDFRLRQGVPYFLEVNPLPGLSPYSGDIVFLAQGVGIDHKALVGRIIAAALARLDREF